MMKSEKIQLWILDTLWEDNYSFSEMMQYMLGAEVSDVALTQSLTHLFEIGYIGVTFLPPGEIFSEREYQKMEFDAQKESIRSFIKIAKYEAETSWCHHLEISDSGLEYYKSLGYGS